LTQENEQIAKAIKEGGGGVASGWWVLGEWKSGWWVVGGGGLGVDERAMKLIRPTTCQDHV